MDLNCKMDDPAYAGRPCPLCGDGWCCYGLGRAPSTPPLRDRRTPKDYAIEHAEYMALAAESFMGAASVAEDEEIDTESFCERLGRIVVCLPAVKQTAVKETPKSWRPLGDSNPCCRRERASTLRRRLGFLRLFSTVWTARAVHERADRQVCFTVVKDCHGRAMSLGLQRHKCRHSERSM